MNAQNPEQRCQPRRLRPCALHRPPITDHWSLVTAFALLALLLASAARGEPARALVDVPMRFGMSARTIAGINRNDAIASLKVWIETIAREQNLPVETDPRIFDRGEDFAAAVARGEIDVVNAPADEFVRLEQVAPMAALYCQTAGGSPAVEYVVLVREESPHRTLADLRGARLLTLTHPTTTLAPAWLDVELARANLAAADGYFREMPQADKVNRAILPVFFKQADACLVTRSGFAVASELNPQLGKQLRILVSSPPLIPNATSHRKAVSDALARGFREAALNLSNTPAGQQILQLYQNDGFVEVTEDAFAPTRALLEEHSRLEEKSDQQSETSSQ